MKVKVTQSCLILQPHGLYSSWNSPGQSTEVGSLSLLQGIFPTQGSNPGHPHCRWILYQLSYKGSPRILEWVAYPFSRESSQPRNQTGVSCIAGRFFTNWPMREDYFPLKGTRNPWTNGRKCPGLTRNIYGSESKWNIKNNWLLVIRTQEPTWRGFHWPKKKKKRERERKREREFYQQKD